jgi:putative tryptophan/tyrosine transport system substrate-binding protein
LLGALSVDSIAPPMNRRAFVTGLGAVLAAPLVAEAQRAAKLWHIGWLSNASPGALVAADSFRRAFSDLGYVEGQNVVVDFRWAEGVSDRLFMLATELVSRNVDVILAIGPQAIRAAKRATTRIPIVMMTSGDPVSEGFVDNLARPGGNVTGVSFLAQELSGKLLQFLKEALPKIARVAVLSNPANGAHSGYWKDVRAAAQTLHIELRLLELRDSGDLSGTLAQAAHADALLLLLDPTFTANARRIAEIAIEHRLPTIYGLPEFADAGGLIAYGASTRDGLQRAASHVAKILKGAKPADLPVEQLSKFELVINARTAKAFGLTIPPSLLLRADQVIE